MKEWWNKICDKLYVKFNYFLENGGGWVVFIIALIAIIFAIVGFYGQNGFNWKWFIFFHLPLYVFCCWALYKAMKMYNKTLKDIDERKKKEQEK